MPTAPLPKSVANSQFFVSWGFPALLGFGVTQLPSATWLGRYAIGIGLLTIITGWQSFGVIAEEVYNDLLLTVDLSLLACYWLLLFYSARLSDDHDVDAALYTISGAIFLFYSIWDLIALIGRDTSAMATAKHLSSFARYTFVIAIIFFALGVIDVRSRWSPLGGNAYRIFAAALWLGALGWWQHGRITAALRDSSHG